jgi:ketosteroid isomerase-like protein
MRKIFKVLVLVALTAAIFLSAQPPGACADSNPAAEGEIKTLELKLAELIVRGDWDEYAKHLAPDYLHTRENGHVENKDEALESLHDVKRKTIVMEMEPASLTIRTYGDTAVSNAEFTITVRDSGQVKSHRTRESDIFVKRDGQWWLVAGQGTTISK